MSKKKIEKTDEQMIAVEEALSKSEKFIENNLKPISIIIGVIVVIIMGYFAFQKYYLQPKETEAQGQMFAAEQYFEQDAFEKALNGDGQYIGFVDIINEYGITKAANLANYYAGISFLKTGEYQKAIDYLSDFSSDDAMVAPMAIGGIGDAYMELGDTDKAIGYYLDAAKESNNDFTAPLFYMKAALSYETQNNNAKALEIYKKIKENYPNSQEYQDIERYISRTEK